MVEFSEGALELCDKIFELSTQISDPYYDMASNLYYGRYYIIMEKYDLAYEFLSKAENIYQESSEKFTPKRDLSAVCLIYNNLAIYYINYNLDYERGLECFTSAAKIAKKYSLNRMYAVVAYNFTLLNIIREDAVSLEFSKEVYDQGIEWDDNFVRFSGALSLAMGYHSREEYTTALKYIEEAINSNLSKSDTPNVYTTYANILNKLGKLEEATGAYRIAMENSSNAALTTSSYVHLSYGNFLLEHNNFTKAISILSQALEFVHQNKNSVFLFQIYKSLSKAYDKVGDSPRSLEYYKKYHEEYTRIFDIQRERELKELSLDYQSVLYEAKINEQAQLYRLESMESSRQKLILSFIVIIVLGFAIFLFIMYRNKNILYTRIVKQYKTALEKEKELVNKNGEQGPISEPLSCDISNRDKELFDLIEQLMRADKIYRDQYLDRDKLAKYVNTNQDYITKAINKCTSKNVPQYINSYRIDEIIRILSDPLDKSTLKEIYSNAGFTSKSNFYQLFHEQVGMSPTKYKEKIRQIS